ncbi:acetyl-CoA carboxylase [Boletus reticuloceps]|uniref:Acetyl-CoA carboxylase n=1 Tax=Boletus reticuloceps TaxID=495285 RepID=A0A8I3A4I7_9AGAM|nr:acetyl-CoA carboxylase [Boletus reticuloceps]
MGPPGVVGNWPYQRFVRCMGTLNDILEGYDNQAATASTFKDLTEVVPDPDLPYSEASSILSTLSGRTSSKLERVSGRLSTARSPGKVLEHYVQDTILPQDRAMFPKQLAPSFVVLEKFMGGLKGHQVHTIVSLLSAYESTEKLFGGNIEARVLSLREQNKDGLDKVEACTVDIGLYQIKRSSCLCCGELAPQGSQ